MERDEGMNRAEVIIEAVPERLRLKHEVYKALDKAAA